MMTTEIPPNSLNKALDYIARTWGTLTRSHKDLLAAVQDQKAKHNPSEKW